MWLMWKTQSHMLCEAGAGSMHNAYSTTALPHVRGQWTTDRRCWTLGKRLPMWCPRFWQTNKLNGAHCPSGRCACVVLPVCAMTSAIKTHKTIDNWHVNCVLFSPISFSFSWWVGSRVSMCGHSNLIIITMWLYVLEWGFHANMHCTWT